MITNSSRWLDIFVVVLLLVHAPFLYAQNPTPTERLRVTSSVNLDADNTYPTGRMVRIGVEAPATAGQVASGTIRITSALRGYDSGIHQLPASPVFYMWDTSGLIPASDYVVRVVLTFSSGKTIADQSLRITLKPNPPVISKLVSALDVRAPARGFPLSIVRTYLLDSGFQGPLGYGWTHTYRMSIVERQASALQGTQLVPVDSVVEVFDVDGRGSYFRPKGDGTYQSPKGDFRTLTKARDGTYQLRGKYGTRFLFDRFGKLTRIVDPNGNGQALGYDAKDRLSTIADDAGQVARFAYDSSDRITSITDPSGRQIRYQYDTRNNLVAVTDAGGFTTRYAYDSKHNLLRVTDPAGKQVLFTADSEDRLTKVSGAGGSNSLTFQYGIPAANKMTITDALGHKTVLTHNDFGKITAVLDPSGSTSSFAYDANLNLTRLTDPNGRQTHLTYDNRGNLLSRVDAARHTVTLTYESNFNRLTSLTDEKGKVTRFEYDPNGNLTAQTYADGSREAFAYDGFGNLTRKTDRKNQTLGYAYDSRGELTQKTFPDGSAHTFGYDARGNLLSAANADGAITLNYDALDRLTLVRYPAGDTVTYAYDAAGNRSQMVYPDGTVLDYTYDALNRLKQLNSGGQTIASYTYDAASRIVRRELENGTYTTYSYDRAGQLLDLVNAKSSSEVISRYGYTYDATGNRIAMSTLEGVTHYSYDALNQLVGVINPNGSTIRYDFDPAGNRTSVSGVQLANYATNDLNQYTNVGGDRYSYDANGNLVSKTTPTATTTYSHDFENHLVQVVTPTAIVRYAYDPFGRRIAKSTSAGTTRYIHDGARVIVEKDNAGQVAATYVFGLRIDEVLVMRRGGQRYYYAQDGLDSVVSLTNATQAVVDTVSYDPYGMPSRTSAVANPYLFTGREYELESSLYFFRNRYYNPSTGRFVSVDPIGILGGTNLYSYVRSNPVNYVDPTGLKVIISWIRPAKCTDPSAEGCISPEPTLEGDWEIWVHWLHRWLIEAWTHEYNHGWRRVNGEDTGNPIFEDHPVGPAYTLMWDPYWQELTRQFLAENGVFLSGDPTFVFPSEQKALPQNRSRSRKQVRVYAHIAVPYSGSLVRGHVPVFGVAGGSKFKAYRVEYGSGTGPIDWTLLTSSTKPQGDWNGFLTAEPQGDATTYGNLATWDTGLRTYTYLPQYPKDHPIDLKGTYTVRLVVTGKDGKSAEDRVTVTVADVIPNAWGGSVISSDRHLTLTVPEQAMRESFRLISAEATKQPPVVLPSDRKLIGNVYELREPGERFTKDATMTLRFDEKDVKGLDRDSLGIWAYDKQAKTWKHLDSVRPAGESVLETTIRELNPYYALMSSGKPGEGSVALQPPAEPVKLQKVSASAGAGSNLLSQDFEQGAEGWSNRDGDVGATVALDRSTPGGTQALKITSVDGGGNFAVNVGAPAFDARDYSVVTFDYRIPAGVKTNFLVKVKGRWYEIGFTDDPKVLENTRVNIAHIGDIQGIAADDQWHTAHFNLYDMLRTRTGNTQVEEMIMADWDVPGYMKLTFGHNAKGATYYVDNFTISRDATAGTQPKGEVVLVDDFNRDDSAILLGGRADTFGSPAGGIVQVSLSEDDASGKGRSLSLAYDVSPAESYSGYLTDLGNVDLRGYQSLRMSVKGASPGQDMLIGLKDGAGREYKLAASTHLRDKIGSNWQPVTIPLAPFDRNLDLKSIDKLTISFENGLSASGTVLVDDIRFEKSPKQVVVDDFERTNERNLVGGAHQTFAYGAAAVSGAYAKSSPNGIYGVSYGGNIGDAFGYDSGLNYAGWTTDLGGIDCTRCATLLFRVRGAKGGEKPNVYLDDGNFKWPVRVDKYARVSPEWQTVTIPLSEFAEYGVDLTHLSELKLAFEWEEMSGTVYIDDIRFGSAAQ